MKASYQLRILFVLIPFCSVAYADEIVLSGVYQGKNIFVQNPAGGSSFCTEEVWVNETKKMANIRSSAYEVDLSFLKMYDSVTVRITHHVGCAPKVLNASVLRPSQQFQFVSFATKGDSLQWTVTGDSRQHTYFVQRMVNNGWIEIQTLKGMNTGAGIYSVPLTSRDQYRIKVQDYKTHSVYYSGVVDFVPVKDYVTFYPKSVTTKITLSRETAYEVRSASGQVIKKGTGTEIPLADLKTGVYYLSINNRTEKFFKK